VRDRHRRAVPDPMFKSLLRDCTWSCWRWTRRSEAGPHDKTTQVVGGRLSGW